ncbi:hypothetical protein F4811DRAFT_506187 [Daldinia bambusicola]|nr:hypothetical protein F4811DRAFT_506187 [Daldinia bambusicola]
MRTLITMPFESRYRRITKSLSLQLNLPPAQFVPTLAAQYLIFEYFDEGGRYDLRTQTDPEFRELVANAVLCGLSRDRIMHSRGFAMLEMIFKGGISPNTPCGLEDYKDVPVQPRYLWYWLLGRMIFVDMEPYSPSHTQDSSEWRFQYKFTELCLRYGADEDFNLVFGPCLRDLLAYCFPQHYEYLCFLLDKKHLNSIETSDIINPPDQQFPKMPTLFLR